MDHRTSVGLDVHARSIVAHGIDRDTGEVFTRRFGSDYGGVIAWVECLPGPVRVSYEAGPTGYGLARALAEAGLWGDVIAPSKLPKVTGRRVKTDRRDAELLAQATAAGITTQVTVPGLAQEQARDLVRARDDTRSDLVRACHRVSKLLLRHDRLWDGLPWGAAHLAWLNGQRFDSVALQAAFDNNLAAVCQIKARQQELDRVIAQVAGDSEFTPVVEALCCLRGISTLTAFGLAVEVGDWDRFSGSTIGAWVGLIPSEYSSGTSRRQGGITKTGNQHARRLLIEAAWKHKPQYRPHASRCLEQRWAKAGPLIAARADLGNRRLHHRWVQFEQRAKKPVTANAAIARELAGWCWSLATMTR
jgi:transposase